MERKVFIYIASSLDGYIAKPGDDLGFLSIVENGQEDYGYATFIKTIDTVIVGRKTYEWVLKNAPDYAHSGKEVFVITRTPRPDAGNTRFYTGDLTALVAQLKDRPGGHIFCDGGAEIVNELLQRDLVDEFTLSVIPILVGDGTRLFKNGRPEQRMELVSARSFEKGLVQLHYKRSR